jgi:hypothetical protein
MIGRRDGCRFGLLLLALPLAAHRAPVRALDISEDSVKAAYLVRFLGFVEWPQQPPGAPAALAGATAAAMGPDAPFVIGVVAADAVFRELAPLIEGRRVDGRPLAARRLRAGEAPDGVHLLHVGRGAPDSAVPRPTPRRPLLVVTDDPQGPPPGSALNFVTVNRRVRFEAAPAAAEHAGLKLSARLLAVAERVLP